MNSPEPSPTSPAFPYTPVQWDARRHFIQTINEIAKREAIQVEWLSHFWVARLIHNRHHSYIVGYSFPVNDGDAAAIARDKVATSEVLGNAGLPVIPHWPLHFPEAPATPDAIASLTDYALELNPLPLVIKPISGSTGRDVYHVSTAGELSGLLQLMSAHHYTIAVCPLVPDAQEYRVIMLKRNAKIVFRKVRPRGDRGEISEWRHNLALGSKPDPVTDPDLRFALSRVAASAMAELGLNLAAVDIIKSSGVLKIIEINTGFTMYHLAQDSRFITEINAVYNEAVQLSISRSN